jgi:hypothetical protein
LIARIRSISQTKKSAEALFFVYGLPHKMPETPLLMGRLRGRGRAFKASSQRKNLHQNLHPITVRGEVSNRTEYRMPETAILVRRLRGHRRALKASPLLSTHVAHCLPLPREGEGPRERGFVVSRVFIKSRKTLGPSLRRDDGFCGYARNRQCLKRQYWRGV